MIDKIKNLAGAMKNLFLFVIGPSLAVMAYIVYLRGRNQDLKDQLEQEKSDITIKETLEKEENANEEAIQSESDYTNIRDLYLRNQQVSGSATYVPASNKSSGQGSGKKE